MQLTILGDTDEGKFALYNINMLKDFCRKNPDKRIVVTVQVEEKESKNAMLSYFYKKVLPEWKQRYFELGTVKTEKEVLNEILKISPITERKSLSELNREEMIEFLDHVKDISLRDFQLIIEDPRLI